MAKTRWTEEMVETLLRTLYEQVVRGERAENGFKKKAWTAAKESLKEAHKIDLEASQLKTKWSNLKKDYDTYMAIKSNSGFGWDEINRVPTAPESVWETYMKAHPEAEKFRKRSLLHYDILHELCANISATGEYALTSNLFSQSDTQLPTSQHTQSQASIPPIITPPKESDQNTKVPREAYAGRGGFQEEGKRLVGAGEREQRGSGEKMGWEEGEVVVGEGNGERGSGRQKRCKRNALVVGSDGEEEEEECRPVVKKSRLERKTTGRAIAQALDRLSATAQTIQRSKVELAVERLQEDYASILTIDELVKAFVVMENEVKASIFISLKPGEARDQWLQEAINKL